MLEDEDDTTCQNLQKAAKYNLGINILTDKEDDGNWLKHKAKEIKTFMRSKIICIQCCNVKLSAIVR